MSVTIELIKQASELLIKSERTNYRVLSADSSLVQLCLQDQCKQQLSSFQFCQLWPGRKFTLKSSLPANSRLFQGVADSSSFRCHK